MVTLNALHGVLILLLFLKQNKENRDFGNLLIDIERVGAPPGEYGQKVTASRPLTRRDLFPLLTQSDDRRQQEGRRVLSCRLASGSECS